ncbi:MAG TPA: hypothetical protein H9722_01340 [Candidatus Mediterraneibacter pullistercoris]|nr:hypothetical protein [Candidatus Mediterraneibacter pullistercoris]
MRGMNMESDNNMEYTEVFDKPDSISRDGIKIPYKDARKEHESESD